MIFGKMLLGIAMIAGLIHGVEEEKLCSLTVSVPEEITEVHLTPVALIQEGEPVFQTGFEMVTADFTDPDEQSYAALVRELASMKKERSIEDSAEGKPEEGKAAFTGLKPGFYLVTADEAYGDDWTLTAVPALVMLPEFVNDHYEYSVSMEMKYEKKAVTRTVTADPHVRKKVTGDKPLISGTFTFTMEGISDTAGVKAMPMPDGSKDGKKTLTITGEGEKEFGIITFTKPGTYVYRIAENKGSDSKYTYDTGAYTLTFDVERQADRLILKQTVTKDGKEVKEIVFENRYRSPAKSWIQTGSGKDVLIAFGVLAVSLLGLAAMALLRKRKE